jgi:hypothetical protein
MQSTASGDAVPPIIRSSPADTQNPEYARGDGSFDARRSTLPSELTSHTSSKCPPEFTPPAISMPLPSGMAQKAP